MKNMRCKRYNEKTRSICVYYQQDWSEDMVSCSAFLREAHHRQQIHRKTGHSVHVAKSDM